MNHGTYAGYQIHIRDKTVPCDACREANRNYNRAYRERRPEYVEHARRYHLARSRALEQLRRAYPESFDRLFQEELG